MTKYTQQAVTYTIVTDPLVSRGRPLTIEAPLGNGQPTLEQWDAAVTAFVSALNAGAAGLVLTANRTIAAIGDPTTTIWPNDA